MFLMIAVHATAALILGQTISNAPKSAYVVVPANVYTVGQKDNPASPLRQVRLKSFQIAIYETTNAQFSKFVKATKFVTDAERLHNAMTFTPPLREFQWTKESTAYWRFPNGKKQGGIEDKMDHPVTCISFRDALAYCKWAGGRLPTIDEWEVATRAGTSGDRFFGDDIAEIFKYGNVWHGVDHTKADLSDGFMRTSPVGKFAANPWGLFDVYGNVFEFCSGNLPGEKLRDMAHARGGSWWCSKRTCCSFNSFDMGQASIYSSFSNQGFRIVFDVSTKSKSKLN